MKTQQSIQELIEKRAQPLLSFEFFPPKDKENFKLLKEASRKMRAASPDFVTVTYGAGGSTQARSAEVCRMLDEEGFENIMPHLTCVGASCDELRKTVRSMYEQGFRNIMALRGDPPKGLDTFVAAEEGLSHASDLVALIKEMYPDVCCGVAGYPETHPEASSPEVDLTHLKLKLDAGGAFVTTQLFYENDVYFDFVERCRGIGIKQPVLPGILPAVSLKQAKRMTQMCNASMPNQLEANLQDAGEHAAAAAAAGIKWATRQIEDLLEKGAPGIHLYVLNREDVALAPELVRCFAKWR